MAGGPPPGCGDQEGADRERAASPWSSQPGSPGIVQMRYDGPDRSGIEKHPAGRAPSVVRMTSIDSVTLDVADPSAAHDFYAAAFGPDVPVRVRASEAPTAGFRGFTLSLVMSQPANVDAVVDAAVGAGATTLKPAAKSLWGYGGMLQAPDGTIWQVVSSSKKNTGPATRQVDDVVLLLGVENVSETKRFYVDRGFSVAKSYGSKYVEFDTASSPVKLALYKRRGLARLAGISPEGSGSHRLVVGSDVPPFTDPDGFEWATVDQPTTDRS